MVLHVLTQILAWIYKHDGLISFFHSHIFFIKSHQLSCQAYSLIHLTQSFLKELWGFLRDFLSMAHLAKVRMVVLLCDFHIFFLKHTAYLMRFFIDSVINPGKIHLKQILSHWTFGIATGKYITSVAAGTKEDVDQAVAAAKETFRSSWGLKYPGLRRGQLLNKLADLIIEHADELAALEALNTGEHFF